MAYGRKTSSIGKAVANLWRTVTAELFDTYRPEQHYMRGPGPKWRAKNTAHSELDLGGMANASA